MSHVKWISLMNHHLCTHPKIECYNWSARRGVCTCRAAKSREGVQMPSEGNVRAPSQDYFGQAGLCIHNSLPLSTQHNGVNACV